jgi:hypothetical protein
MSLKEIDSNIIYEIRYAIDEEGNSFIVFPIDKKDVLVKLTPIGENDKEIGDSFKVPISDLFELYELLNHKGRTISMSNKENKAWVKGLYEEKEAKEQTMKESVSELADKYISYAEEKGISEDQAFAIFSALENQDKEGATFEEFTDAIDKQAKKQNESFKEKKNILEASEGLLSGYFIFSTTDGFTLEELIEEQNITLDWDLLNKDVTTIDYNFIKLLKRELDFARDEGHDKYDALVGSIEVDASKIPSFLYKNSQDDSNYDNKKNMLIINYLNEKINDYDKELLKGTSEYGFLLLEAASLEIGIEAPNDLYLEKLN